MTTQETSLMRRFFSRRVVITLELAFGLLVFALFVSGCFQSVGAALNATPGEGTPTLGFTATAQPAGAQPTPLIVIQPTPTGLFPPTAIAPPTAAAPKVAQAATATQNNVESFGGPE